MYRWQWLWILIFVVGCGASHHNWKELAESDSATTPLGMKHQIDNRMAAVEQLEIEAERQQAGDNANPPASLERKIIYTGNVNLVVTDFAEMEKQLKESLKQFDAYISSADIQRAQGQRRSGSWTVRVPVNKFHAFLASLESLGIPESRRIDAKDVTEEFVDITARMTSQKKLEERILKILEERAGKIQEVLEVERELARVRSQIEQMEGRIRFLSNQSSLSTVTIYAREEQHFVPPQAPTFAGQISQTWMTSLANLQRFGEGLLLLLVGAAPWLVVGVVVGCPSWWILRRAFRKKTTTTNRSTLTT